MLLILAARPRCSRCTTLQTRCLYDANEGESRWQALRRRNRVLESKQAEIRELLQHLRTCPESEALVTLKFIRTTTHEDVLDELCIVGKYRHRSADHPWQAIVLDSNSGMRLPGIETMFEAADGLQQKYGPHGGQCINRQQQENYSRHGSTALPAPLTDSDYQICGRVDST